MRFYTMAVTITDEEYISKIWNVVGDTLPPDRSPILGDALVGALTNGFDLTVERAGEIIDEYFGVFGNQMPPEMSLWQCHIPSQGSKAKGEFHGISVLVRAYDISVGLVYEPRVYKEYSDV